MKAGISPKYYADVKKAVWNPFDLEYAGFEQNDDFMGWIDNYEFILGVGDNRIRDKLGMLVLSKGKQLVTVAHPRSEISDHSKIGIGTFVSAGVCINAFAEVRDFSILNTGCVVEHECKLGRAVHIGPGAVLAGNVTVGDRTFIGANAVIKEGVVIGDNVIVGAGSTILRNVENNMVVVGSPGREL